MSIKIIAEIGINHNGDVSIAKKLIDAASLSGCDYVKFQKRTPDICVPEEQKDKLRQTPWGEIKYIDYPWPKKNSFSYLNEKNNNIPVKNDGIILYYKPYPNQLCHYSKSPCTHVVDLKVNKKNILNYNIFYKN